MTTKRVAQLEFAQTKLVLSSRSRLLRMIRTPLRARSAGPLNQELIHAKERLGIVLLEAVP